MPKLTKEERARREAKLPLFKNIPVGRAFLSPAPGEPIVLRTNLPLNKEANLEPWTRLTVDAHHGGKARNLKDGRIVTFLAYSTAFLREVEEA